MKVLMLTQLFYPELVSSGQTLTELAEALRRQDVDVDVICAKPTLIDSAVPKRLTYKGISIRRVVSTRFSKSSLLGRLFNAFTFMFSVFLTLLFDFKKRPILLVTNPPFLVWVVAILRMFGGKPFIFLVFDVYPDTAIECGFLSQNSVISRLWRALNLFAYKKASRIIVIGRCMEERLKSFLPQELYSKIKRIHVWADDALIGADQPERHKNTYINEWNLEGRFVVLYSGNMGRFHDMATILRAADRLREYEDIVFLFVGEGEKKKEVGDYVSSRGLHSCRLFTYVPRDKLPHLLAAAHVGLVSLLPGHEGLSVPSKTFGLMSAGVPVIGVLPDTSEIALILKENKAGVVVPPGDDERLSNAILSMYRDKIKAKQMGDRGQSAVFNTYSLAHAAAEYKTIISDLN